MLRIMICITAIFLSAIVFPQNGGSFVSLRAGVSIPVGLYQSKSLEEGCFTLPGFHSGVEGAWFVLKHLGIGGQFGINYHPVDVSSLGYAKVQEDPFLTDVTIRSDSYQVITGTIGLFTRWDFWKVLSLHGELLGGMMWAKTPYQLYKPQYFLVGPEYFEITSSKDRNFMGAIGAGLQIEAGSCLAFRVDGEYQYSKMTFGFTTATGIRYEYRNISYVNASLALVIKL